MRILVLAPRFHTNLYYRVQALLESGHTVKVLVLYKGKSEFHNEIDVQQIEINFISNWFSKIKQKFSSSPLKNKWELLLLAPSPLALWRLLRSFRPDALLVKAYLNLFSEISVWLANVFGIPVFLLIQSHKNTLVGSNWLLKAYLYYVELLGVKGYLTPIKINENNFRALGKQNVSYLPFVYPSVQPTPAYSANFIRIMCVGKFVPRKNQLLLLKVFALLQKTYQLRLYLVGEKADKLYLNEVLNYIDKNGLNEFVDIRYNISYDKMSELYLSSHLFVLPSYKEPAAYSLVEAMGHGLPVVCSDDCGTSCYVEKGTNGEVFISKSKDDLALKLELILQNLQHYRQGVIVGYKSQHELKTFSSKLNLIIGRSK